MKKHLLNLILLGGIIIASAACSHEDGIVYPELDQESADTYLEWEDLDTIKIDYKEQGVRIKTSSKIKWRIALEEQGNSGTEWCTPSVTEGNSYCDFTIAFDENMNTSDRRMLLHCVESLRYDENGNLLVDSLGVPLTDTVSVPIIQTMAPTRIGVDVDSLDLGPLQTNILVKLSSNTAWEIETIYTGETDWLIVPRTSGSGNFNIVARVNKNNSGVARAAQLKISMTNPNDIDTPAEEKEAIYINIAQSDKLAKPTVTTHLDAEMAIKWNEIVGATSYILAAEDLSGTVLLNDSVLTAETRQVDLGKVSLLNNYVGVVKWSVHAVAQDLVSETTTVELHSHFDLESGDGSAIAPYVLSAPYQFQNIMKCGMDKHYVMNQDINMENVRDFTPISTGKDNLGFTGEFTGTFDGQGHAISNLMIDHAEEYYVGLFAQLGAGSTVTNLTFKNHTVRGKQCVGSLAGIARGTVEKITTDEMSFVGAYNVQDFKVGGIVGSYQGNGGVIRDCVNKAEIGEELKGDRVAGIVGHVNVSCTIENCTNEGPIMANSRAAGIVGEIANEEVVFSVNILNSHNSAEILLNGGGNRMGGGIVGIASKCNLTIEKSSNTADVTGGGTMAGIVGRYIVVEGAAFKITNCFNSGDITNIANNNVINNSVGGLIAKREGAIVTDFSIVNSYNSGVIDGGKCSMHGAFIGASQPQNDKTPILITAINLVALDSDGSAATDEYLDMETAQAHEFVYKNASAEQMKLVETYQGWDFSTVWEMGNNFPVIK